MHSLEQLLVLLSHRISYALKMASDIRVSYYDLSFKLKDAS